MTRYQLRWPVTVELNWTRSGECLSFWFWFILHSIAFSEVVRREFLERLKYFLSQSLLIDPQMSWNNERALYWSSPNFKGSKETCCQNLAGNVIRVEVTAKLASYIIHTHSISAPIKTRVEFRLEQRPQPTSCTVLNPSLKAPHPSNSYQLYRTEPFFEGSSPISLTAYQLCLTEPCFGKTGCYESQPDAFKTSPEIHSSLWIVIVIVTNPKPEIIT